MDAWLRGKKVRLDPARAVGKGGEAEVFEVGQGRAVKIFKAPDHPDLVGQPVEIQAARDRIAEHQTKLRDFPRGLPAAVVAPEALVTDRGGNSILGYEMQLIAAAEPLARWADPAFRRAGATQSAAAALLRGLHAAVLGIHAAGAVIGDFNDLNLLVSGADLFVIDADSFQYGRYSSRVFTERFVDPLLCDAGKAAPALIQPHTRGSDWYAFAALLCQTLLQVGPHGGVHKPKDPAQRCLQPARALRRLSVFHPEVQYPKPAALPTVLPDEVLHELVRIFERDVRGVFPRALLESIEFRQCPRCALEHCRKSCPRCSPQASTPAVVTVVRGQVRSTLVARTRGVFLCAALQGGELRWLAHEEGRFLREDGSVPLEGRLDPAVRYALRGKDTILARGGEAVVLRAGTHAGRIAVDLRGIEPALAAGPRRIVHCAGGLLLRDGEHGPETIGEVLAGRTRLWLGESLGMGLYDAGSLLVAFLFDPERRGLNDSLSLPKVRGQLVSTACVPGPDRAWLRLTSSESGRLIHRVLLYDAAGALLGKAEAGEGEPEWPWLDAFASGCAAGAAVLVATDDGLVRVEASGGALGIAKAFPDTEPFVEAGSQLFAGSQGLFVIGRQEIKLLQLK